MFSLLMAYVAGMVSVAVVLGMLLLVLGHARRDGGELDDAELIRRLRP